MDMKLQLSREEMKELCREQDMDGDGVLNMREVTQAFSMMGSCMPMYRARYALKYADADGDGCITEDELEKLIDFAMKHELKNNKKPCNVGNPVV